MRTMRNSVFETNSSSTHCLTICSESEFNDYVEGRSWYCRDDEKLFTAKEMYDYIGKKDDSDEDESEPLPEFERFCEILKKLNRSSYDYDDSDLAEDELNMKQLLHDYSFYPYKDCCPDYESFEQYATVGGVKVVAFGYYGFC